MSKQSLTVQSLTVPSLSAQRATPAQRQWRRWIVALVLAAALAGLPVLTSGPLAPLFAQSAQAGCNIGGTCG